MDFDIKNAPSTFSTLINEKFKDIFEKCVVIYLDNMIVFSKSRKENEGHLLQILKTLQKHHLVAKPSKFELFNTELFFLGHIITKSENFPGPAKMEAFPKMPPPKGFSELCTFFSIIVYVLKLPAGCDKLITAHQGPWL